MVELRPMLAQSIPLDEIGPYLENDRYVAQQKVDGDRLMVTVEDGVVQALNREGLPRSNPVPPRVLAPFEKLPERWCFDGELLDGTLWLFDLPIAGEAVTPTHPYRYRLDRLNLFMGVWQPANVRVLPTARTQWAKTNLVNRVLAKRGEGVVFRDLDGTYLPGPRRTKRLVKAKLVKTVDCVVTGVRRDGKDNCHVSLFEDGHLVEVGSCAMLGKPAVHVGQVVEVRYLYADTNRRLVQAAFLRVRDDKPATECTIDQLVFTNRAVLDQGGMMSRVSRDPGKGLGRAQVEILHLLALGSKSVRQLTMEGFSDSGARNSLHRLGVRGLVDRKFRYNELEYFLTKTGEEVEQLLLKADEDEEVA